MSEMQRVFIAIDLSPEVQRWLENARSILKSGAAADAVRWVDSKGIHITIKFLGEISAERIASVRDAMDRSMKNVKPFMLVVERVGCFPNLARPRVVWAGVRAEPALLELQQRLEDQLSAAGFERERRAFSPHLTLGRVRDGVSEAHLRKIGETVGGAKMAAPLEMPVNGACLYRSILTPSGSEYSVLYRVEFSGR
jgi:2'-5' RNA ligase